MIEKALALISGGIDSPVAAYMVKRFGIDVIAVHFSIEVFTGKEPVEKTKKIVEKLGLKKLIVIDVSKEFEEIAKKCRHKLYFVLTKRFMLRVAERIAKDLGCNFLITGENIGQVSSQTISNLITISRAVSLPVVRPLLCFDKSEIINFAEDIGTFEISKGPELCDLLGPKHPATISNEDVVLKEEGKLDMEKLIENAVNRAELVSLI